jgi:hypothetical protein
LLEREGNACATLESIRLSHAAADEDAPADARCVAPITNLSAPRCQVCRLLHAAPHTCAVMDSPRPIKSRRQCERVE